MSEEEVCTEKHFKISIKGIIDRQHKKNLITAQKERDRYQYDASLKGGEKDKGESDGRGVQGDSEKNNHCPKAMKQLLVDVCLKMLHPLKVDGRG